MIFIKIQNYPISNKVKFTILGIQYKITLACNKTGYMTHHEEKRAMGGRASEGETK